MIFPGGMNKITSHQLNQKFSDLKLVRRELPILSREVALSSVELCRSLHEEVVGHLEVGPGLGVPDVVVDGVEVVEGDGDEVLGVAAQQDLLLHSHHHQVVQLRWENTDIC